MNNSAIKPHASLHIYDINNLTNEISVLTQVTDLLKNTQVPEYVHLIIAEQLGNACDYLKNGMT